MGCFVTHITATIDWYGHTKSILEGRYARNAEWNPGNVNTTSHIASVRQATRPLRGDGNRIICQIGNNITIVFAAQNKR